MLQQSDVNELLNTLAASQDTESARSNPYAEVKIYDFSRPDNIPSEFFRTLETINAAFARNLASMITRDYSITTQVDALNTDQVSFRQFCNSVPEVSAVGTFTLAPFDGLGVIELNPHLAWYLLDRGLGGQGEIIDQPRAFTSLSRGLLDDLFRRMLREFVRAWESQFPLQPRLRDVFSTPSQARVAQPEDRMLVCSFGITLPDINGMTTYGIPVYNLNFEQLMSHDGTDGLSDANNDPEIQRRQVLRNLQLTPVMVRACLGDATINLRELAAAHIGDVIPFKETPNDPIEVRVGAVRRLLGRPIVVDDHVAIEIQGVWTEDE